LILYSALFFGFFGLLANLFLTGFRASKSEILLSFLLPSLWVALEFARGSLFTGFPWAILGYTQYRNPAVIQIADTTGPYGVSFLIVMVNFVLYSYFSRSFGLRAVRRKDSSALKFQAIISVLILAAAVLYGYFRLGEDDIKTNIKLSLIQGNIEQAQKWDPVYEDYILQRYNSLTQEAAKEKSELIVWPETAVPGFLDEEGIDIWLKRLLKDINTPLLLGAVTYESREKEDYFFNSAVLFSTNGDVKNRYDKLHLVPFGEYVPFEKCFPFIRNFINVEMGDFTAGEKFTLFDISKDGANFKYAALICFEDIFPDLVRRFVLGGADSLINITNDAWFKESSEQLQHAQASVFRAVENRASVLRAANTGFSCYISPKGIIEDGIYSMDLEHMYIPGVKTFELKVNGRTTFYTRYGDVFSYICIFVVLICWIGLATFRLLKNSVF